MMIDTDALVMQQHSMCVCVSVIELLVTSSSMDDRFYLFVFDSIKQTDRRNRHSFLFQLRGKWTRDSSSPSSSRTSEFPVHLESNNSLIRLTMANRKVIESFPFLFHFLSLSLSHSILIVRCFRWSTHRWTMSRKKAIIPYLTLMNITDTYTYNYYNRHSCKVSTVKVQKGKKKKKKKERWTDGHTCRKRQSMITLKLIREGLSQRTDDDDEWLEFGISKGWEFMHRSSRSSSNAPNVPRPNSIVHFTFANVGMCQWKIFIAIKCFFAITAMSTSRIMFALHADPTRFSPRKKV